MTDPLAVAARLRWRERLAAAAQAGLARARVRGEGPAVISLGESLAANSAARVREAQGALEDAVSAAVDMADRSNEED